MQIEKNSLSKRIASVWAIALFFMTAQLMPLSALAETGSTSAAGQSATGGSTAASGSSSFRNLDLSSTTATVAAAKTGTVLVGGQVGAGGTVSGGTPMSVIPGQLLTPATNTALWQSAVGGNQSLLVNAAGAAAGGSVRMNSTWASNLSSLVVPAGVTVNAVGFNTANPLNVSGASNILGSLHALQSTAGITALLNFGNNLNIAQGGLLTGNLPANMNLPGLFSSQNLVVNVLGNFSNNGTVSAIGNLNLNVTGSLNNTTLPGASTATLAAQNINIMSGSGNIVNSGLISALNNININTMDALADLNLNNTGGTLQALANINLRDAASAGYTNLNGGDWLSQQLNFDSAKGHLNASVNEVTGVVNVEACTARVYADTDSLKIGNWNLSGDPVMASSGNVDIGGNVNTNGGPLLIVAGQNVRSTAAGISINTESGTGDGGTLSIFAGANFSPDPYTAADETAGVPLTITGVSATGGSIDFFTGGPIAGISSKSTAAVGNGGNITLAAFEGATAGTGKITLPFSSTVASGGNGDAGPGFIFLVAGASTKSAASPGIFAGNLDSSGGFHVGETGLAGGHQVITTEQPNISPANPMVIDVTTGTPLRGGVLGGATAESPILVRSIKTEGGQIIAFSGLGLAVGDATTIGTNVVDTAPPSLPGGMVTMIANASGNTTENVDMVINGDINTSGAAAISGPVAALTSGNFQSGDITTSNTSPSGDAASIFIVAGSQFSAGNITVGNIDTSGLNGDAGNVELISMGTFGPLRTIGTGAIDTSSATGNAGAVTISSPGSVQILGDILSTGAINGGSVFLASGSDVGAQLSTSNITTSTSSSSPSDFAGGVYALSNSTVSPAPITGIITQTQAAGTATQNVLAYAPTRVGITGSDTVILNFTNAVTPFEYVPGGYNLLDDQNGAPGGTQVSLTIGNNDPNLIVPMVALNGTLTLIGTAGNPSSIISNTDGNSSYALLSSSGINVGGANAFLTSTGPIPIALVASTMSSIDVDNSSSSGEALVVGAAMAASGPLSLSSNDGLTTGPMLNAYATGTSISLDAIGTNATLNINYNITFGSNVSLMPTGTGNISQNINIFPSVIGGGGASVGNPSMTGNISGPLSIDATSMTINSDLTETTNTFDILNVGNVNLVFNTGAQLTLTAGATVVTGNSAATAPATGTMLTLDSLTVDPGVTLSASSGDLTINTSQVTNGGTISTGSSNDIWIFPSTGSDLTISNANGFMSADNVVWGLSPTSGGTVTNSNLIVSNSDQTIAGNLGLFSSATGFPGEINISGSALTTSGGINIDTPTLVNAGSLIANGTVTVPGASPGAVGIFAENQRGSAGITIGGGGSMTANPGGIYIQSEFPNGIVFNGSQTFNSDTQLIDAGDDGFTVDAGATINANADMFISTSNAVINGTINFNSGGVIFSSGDIGGSGLLTALTGTMSLVTFGGNIGSALVPLEVSSGASGVNNLNLDIFAPSGAPGTGNAWLLDNDADPGLVGNPAVFLNAIAGSGEGVATSGNFTMTATAGSIGIHPDELTASSSITLVAQRSIIQKHGETLTAPVINLTAVDGNVGLSETSPTLVSSGNSGITQLSLTANAKANTPGNGNIWISSPDLDITWGVPKMAMALGASAAGSSPAVDATTGNFQITTTAGGIAVSGAATASSVITFNSDGSILQGTGGSLTSPNINLTSTRGNIGSSKAALVISSGTSGVASLNMYAVATANTNGNGNVWLTSSDLDSGPLGPAILLFGEAGSGTPAFQSGNFSLILTQGTIGIHPTTLTASSSITLLANQSIIQLHGEVVQAPRINLTATLGNIGLPGSIPFIVSRGNSGSALQLTVNAANNLADRGNVFVITPSTPETIITNGPDLILVSANAGTGVPVGPTTGNLDITSSTGGLGFNGAVTASSSLSLSANTDIVKLSGGSLSSPTMNFTSTTGNVGQISVPIVSDAATLSANAQGNVFLSASNNSLTLGASSGNTFILTVTGGSASTTITNLNANNITLQSTTASNGAFILDGTIGGQTTANASNVIISAGGTGDITYTSGIINTNSLDVSSELGTIGFFLDPIFTNAATLTANAGTTAINSGIFINDSNPTNINVNASTSANWFELVALTGDGNVTVNGPITAGDTAGGGSLIIDNIGNITLNASLVSNNANPNADGLFLQTNNFGVISQSSGTLNTAGSVIVIDAGYGNIGSASRPISVSGATPQINVNFASVGDVFLSSPNNLRVFNGEGNNIQLTAANGVTIAGLTNVNNLSITTTNAGDVHFDTGSLALISNNGNANSVTVNVNGNATITSTSFDLNANSVTLVSAAGDIGASAAPITINSAFLSVSTLAHADILNANTGIMVLGPITASDFSLASAGGITQSGIINVAGNLNLIANSQNLIYNGSVTNNLVLRAPNGTITLPSPTLSVIPDSAGNGGSVTVVARRLAVAGIATFSDLRIDARGSGTGNGGTIDVTLNSATPVQINTSLSGKNPPPTQVMALDASPAAGGGAGGTIGVTTGGNLTVFTTALSAAAVNGDGANITLRSGGNLLVNGPINANAAGTTPANGGSITLQSSSPTIFTIGGTSTSINGIVKNTTCPTCLLLSVNRASTGINGSISVSNLGGGVTDTLALTAVNSLSFSAGAAGSVLVKNSLGTLTAPATSTITLSATGTGNVTSTSTKIQAGTLNLTAAAGTIGTATVPLQFTANTLNANAPGANGVVNLTDLTTGAISLGASSAGKSFKLTASKATNIADTGTISSPILTLAATVGSIGDTLAHLQVNASTITLTAKGLVAADNLNPLASTLNKSSGLSFTFSSAGNLNLNSVSTTGGAIDIQNNAGILQVLPAAVITTKSGSIVLRNNDITNVGTIIIGNRSRVVTTGPAPGVFPVTISVGPSGVLSTINPNPATIRIVNTTGGQANFSTTGITAIAPINTINLKGSDVTLDAGTNGSINLNGQTTITADPVIVRAPIPGAGNSQANSLYSTGSTSASTTSTPAILSPVQRQQAESNFSVPRANTSTSTFSWTGNQTGSNLIVYSPVPLSSVLEGSAPSQSKTEYRNHENTDRSAELVVDTGEDANEASWQNADHLADR